MWAHGGAANSTIEAEGNRKEDDADFRVRRANIEDWLDVHEIFQSPRVIHFTGHAAPPSKDTVRERWESRLGEPGVHTLVAQTKSKVVGYVRLKQGQGKGSHVGDVSTVAVHQDWQGGGVGTLLTKAILELADDSLHLKRLRLTVHDDNRVAIHLYEKLGFKIEGAERKAAYKDGKYVDVLVMGRIRD